MITGALVAAGATLLTADGGGGGGGIYEVNGKRVDANDCWQDGSGPCANGNCFDDDGPKGFLIKETTVSCKWFCFHRAHCKTQICCKEV